MTRYYNLVEQAKYTRGRRRFKEKVKLVAEKISHRVGNMMELGEGKGEQYFFYNGSYM